jgi:hypothetical protein
MELVTELLIFISAAIGLAGAIPLFKENLRLQAHSVASFTKSKTYRQSSDIKLGRKDAI